MHVDRGMSCRSLSSKMFKTLSFRCVPTRASNVRRSLNRLCAAVPDVPGQPDAAPEDSIANVSGDSQLGADLGRQVDKHVNPVTGNPQTGKLIDVYFEIGSLAIVVLLSAWSLFNAQHVLKQVGGADMFREPATKQEWMAMDTKSIYGPCGGSQEHDEAMEDLFEGRPCTSDDYARLLPATQNNK